MNDLESIIVTIISFKEYFFIDFLEDTIDLCMK